MPEPTQEPLKESADGTLKAGSEAEQLSTETIKNGSASEASASEYKESTEDNASGPQTGSSNSKTDVSGNAVSESSDKPETSATDNSNVNSEVKSEDVEPTKTGSGELQKNETQLPDSEKSQESQAQTEETLSSSGEMKRKSSESDVEPDSKKPKVDGEEGRATTEMTSLEKAKAAAERSRIDLYPELDPVQLPPPGTGLLKHQHKYALSAIRAIKRSKDAGPFLAPVDPVRQGVPHYFDYIKHPMDLGTIEKRLVDNKYDSVQALVDDFNLMVSNCIVFNGEDALISKMALGIAQSFKKQLSNMPTYDATRKGSQAAAAAASQASSNSSATGSTNGTATASGSLANGDSESALHEDHVGKRSSTTTTIVGPNGLPTLRRKSTIDGRPKREIRPPRHPGSFPGSGTGEGRPRNKKYASELRFAGQVLREMQSRKLEAISFPFLMPVDPIEQGVPTYFDVIKEPMDLSTIQKKLAEGIYYTGDEFESDVRLMFRNCYTFNPEGTPVNVMGHKLEAYFDSRWVEKPVPGAPAAEDSEASDVDEEYAESGMVSPAIDVLEEQVRLIKKQLKRLKKDALAEYYKRGNRRSSSAPKRRRSSHNGTSGSSGSSSHSRPLPTEMTYEMKRDLRDKIDKLPEKKIRTVIAIIQESMPDLGNNGQDEIELEVDALDTTTLLRLYNYAVLGRREEPSTGSVSGAGSAKLPSQEYDSVSKGVKRRSKALSEEEHERKIAEIESKLKEFDHASGQSAPGTPASNVQAAGSAVTADAADDSDSSDEDQLESDDSSSEEE